MALSSSTATISYFGNGSTSTPYPIPFKFFSNDHIQLYADGVLVDTGYTITGSGLDEGGELTGINYSELVKITILRVVPLDQVFQYREGDPLPAANIEDNHDRTVMQVQQLAERQSRSLSAPVGETFNSPIKLKNHSSWGQDEEGNHISRTSEEEVAFLGLGNKLEEAANAANTATTSATNAAQAAALAENARDSVIGFLSNKKAIVFSSDGQSNEVGNQANVTSFDEADMPLSNMYQFSRGAVKNYYDQKGYGQFIPAHQTLQYPDNVSWIDPDSKEVSSAFYFAKAYALENPDTDVYLICNAVGATGFIDNSWGRGDSLRKRSIEEAKEVLKQLRKQYNSVFYGGIKMHQGEDDVGLADYADQFYDAFEYAREEMSEGDFPIIIGTMLQSWVGSSSSRLAIDAVHRNIAANVRNSAFADLDGLTDAGVGDNLHFGAEALKVAGQRYYDVWKMLSLQSEATPVFEVYLDSGNIVSPLLEWEPSSSLPSVVGDFMQFNGGKYIRFSESLPVGSFSKVIVAKINNSANANLMSHHLTDKNGLIFSTNAIGGQNKLAASGNGTQWPPSSNAEALAGSSTIDTTETHVYALTFDGEKLSLYIDGILDGEISELDNVDVFRTNVSVGEYRGSFTLNADVYYAGLFEGVVSANKLVEIHDAYVPDMPDPQALTIQNRFEMADATDSTGSGLLTILSGSFNFLDDAGTSILNFLNSSFNTGLQITGSTTRVVRYRTSAVTGNLVSGAGNNSLPLFFYNNDLTFGNIATGKIQIPVGANNWLDGSWHTIAASWDDVTKVTRVAIDGVVVGTGSQDITLGANVYLGSFNSSSLRLNGDMDFVEIYSGSASESELIALSQKTTT